MGQYYLTVNPVKRQYLCPHKFGSGLKLMEFSGVEDALPQALCILLAHSNDRGGGDLRIKDCDYKKSKPGKPVYVGKGIKDEDAALVGSWAGDPIVVAGDYDDPWLFVPEDLKGKEYTWEETAMEDVPSKPGWQRETKRKIKHVEVFGKRKCVRTGEVEDHDETLYSAATHFFEDISERIMRVIALAESPYHPFAAVDLSDDGWRDIPRQGYLPTDREGKLKEPKKPLAGKKAWNAYKKHAKPYQIGLVDDLAHYIKRYGSKDELLALLDSKLKEG